MSPRSTYCWTARFSTARESHPYGSPFIRSRSAMHHATSGSHGIRASVAASGRARMSWKPCSNPETTLWARSTVMIASQWAAPSSDRWSKKLAGYSLPRAMPCRSG